MARSTHLVIVGQIESLTGAGFAVDIQKHPGTRRAYEVTIHARDPDEGHSHHEGETLAEAMNRAFKAYVAAQHKSEERKP